MMMLMLMRELVALTAQACNVPLVTRVTKNKGIATDLQHRQSMAESASEVVTMLGSTIRL
jgi:hypothetical protein